MATEETAQEEDDANLWEASAIGKVIIEGRMSYDMVVQFIKFTWPFLTESDMQIIEVKPNLMLFKFNKWDSLNRVINERPWNINMHLLVVHDFIPEMIYTEKHWGFQQFWLQLKFILPEHMNVSVVTKIGSIMGEVVAIDPKDAIPVGGFPVKVCVNIYLTNPMRRGIKAITNASVKKAHDKPYYFGNPKAVRKNISTISTSSAPTSKPAQRKFVKNTVFVPPKDGEVVNLNFQVSHQEGETIMEDNRLGKRSRTNEDASSTVVPESSASAAIAFIKDLQTSLPITTKNNSSQAPQMESLGFKNSDTRNHLSDLVRTQNPDIIFLFETKLNSFKCAPLPKQFHYPNNAHIEPQGLSGGLVLLWKHGFSYNIIDTSHNMINVVVQADLSKPECLLTCMYGYSNYSKKKVQWNHIQAISNDINKPLVLLGDLNFHLLDCDTSASTSADGMVNNIISSCGLEDLRYVGKSYTWTNNNMGTGTKHFRIDMALGNVDWSLSFPNNKLYHLSQLGSDHSPIMLVTYATIPSCWKPFKFFLTWMNDSTCNTVIADAWSSNVYGTPAYQLVSKQHITRKKLSLWNKEHFGSINQNVDRMQEELKILQEKPTNPSNKEEISKLNNDLSKWHKIKGELYQQKSRDNFIKDMDNNNKYFHTRINRRKCRNNIDSIQDHENKLLQTRDEISCHLTMHFKNISTSINPILDESLYSVFPSIISDEDNVALTRIPSNEEIHNTLKSMKNWSAPGPEGFQDGFYKSKWDLVGEDVCLMVKKFFESKHILKNYVNFDSDVWDSSTDKQ
ncbi:uncharacterized protein LOC113312172 [Papaver somniferum]|uniref:uncharacterized protein LOC113312172 n=1 Tax=Papaver somniferum TaxID=3469 RepID=UPI000E6F885F|nr:uncharacterized protein LOC113312172 [Papaver somniferum]